MCVVGWKEKMTAEMLDVLRMNFITVEQLFM